jgi:hypothetical protein
MGETGGAVDQNKQEGNCDSIGHQGYAFIKKVVETDGLTLCSLPK